MIVIIPVIVIVGFLAWMLRPGKKPVVHIRNTILVITIPFLLVAIAAVIFQILHNASGTIEVAEISNTLFIVGLSLIGAYILASIGFIIARKMDMAKGTGFGICICIFGSIIELGLLEWLGGV